MFREEIILDRIDHHDLCQCYEDFKKLEADDVGYCPFSKCACNRICYRIFPSIKELEVCPCDALVSGWLTRKYFMERIRKTIVYATLAV